MAVNVRPDVSRTRTAPTPATGWTRPGNWYDWFWNQYGDWFWNQYGGRKGSGWATAMKTWWENESRRLQAEANAPAREAAEAAQREADMSQPAREPVLMPDYVQPPAAPAPGVDDLNLPEPPDPNVPDQNAPDPGLNLTPAYQSLGMDAAFMGPAKPRPQRRGGVYNLVLGEI